MLRESRANGFVRSLFDVGLYKRNQGRRVRQATFGSLALIVVIGAWKLNQFFLTSGPAYEYLLPAAFLALGLWLSFRVVNMPTAAEFLISVELELNKVSWPSRPELIRSSIVVMVTIFALGFLLFFFDLFWSKFFSLLGISG